MSIRGRKPKPQAIRLLHGSVRRPHHRVEPPIAPVTPETIAPPPLTDRERAYWDYYAPILAGARVLTAADRDALADYCRAAARVDDLLRQLRDGVSRVDPLVRQWLLIKTRLACELGLTAVSRARVAWQPEAAAEASPLVEVARLVSRARGERR